MLSQEDWDSSYKNNETPWREAVDVNNLLKISDVHGGVALDLGCGTGEWALELAKVGFQVEGLDFSDAALKIANEQRNTVTWTKWDLEDLANYDSKYTKYDLIIDHKVLAFISNKGIYLDTIKKLLKGTFVLTVFHEHEKTGICVSKEEFDRLVTPRFTVCHSDIFNPRPGKVFATYYLQ